MGMNFWRRWRSLVHPVPPESKVRDLTVGRSGPGQMLMPAESLAPRWDPKLQPTSPGPDSHGLESGAGERSKTGASPPTTAWPASDELAGLGVRRVV